MATVRSRVFFVNYPVSFSLRYLYIRPISRHVCVSVCLFVGHRESSPEDTGPQYRTPHEYRTVPYSRILFVTLSKSETYKETIVRVLVPQSLVLIAKLIIVLVLYGIADYALWWAGGDSPIS